MRLTPGLLFLGCATIGLCAGAGAADAPKLPPASTQAGVTFAKDIQPLLAASCVRCHGAEKPKAKLRLDSLDGVLKGGEDGKVVLSGQSASSRLVLAVARVNPKTAMPPEPRQGRPRGAGGAPGTNAPPPPMADARRRPQGPPPKPLTPEQVGLVRAWIDQGVH